MKLYMWRLRDTHTIFALAPNLNEARAIAIAKITGNPLKAEVTAAVQKEPNVTENTHSFIFETGAQFIG